MKKDSSLQRTWCHKFHLECNKRGRITQNQIPGWMAMVALLILRSPLAQLALLILQRAFRVTACLVNVFHLLPGVCAMID
jgi:hypothetical protein